MNFMELLNRLEDYHCEYDLQEVEVTCNKINEVKCLILKHEGKVFEVVVL